MKTLKISYTPGPDQAIEANNFFKTLAGEHMRPIIDGLDPQQVIATSAQFPPAPMRIWCREKFGPTELFQLLTWLTPIYESLTEVSKTAPPDLNAIQAKATHWLKELPLFQTFAIELYSNEFDLLNDLRGKFTLAVNSGFVKFLSIDGLFFTQIDKGQYGLALEKQGSCFIEQA